MTYKPSKIGQTDLIFNCLVRDRSSSAGLYTQNYRTLRIYHGLWFMPPWLTHRQTCTPTNTQIDSFRPVILLAQPASWVESQCN